jgi:hypothetical protein
MHNNVTFSQLAQYHKNISAQYHSNLQKLVKAGTMANYKNCCLKTGLCKQTVFSGLWHTLGIPNISLLDIMHLITLNDPDLFLSLWHGMIKVYPPDKCEHWEWTVLVNKVWDAHGKTVALCTPYIPSSFG